MQLLSSSSFHREALQAELSASELRQTAIIMQIELNLSRNDKIFRHQLPKREETKINYKQFNYFKFEPKPRSFQFIQLGYCETK